MSKQEKLKDIEAARHLSQALVNLPDDYPDRGEAFKAYGRLIFGRLGIFHPYNVRHIHKSGLITLEKE